MTERRSVRVLVTGRVQGVGFRAFVAREAAQRPVDGFVRNLHDGRVEALFSGSADDVAALCEACGRGPWGARVEHVEVREAEPPAQPGFKVLRDA